MTARPEFLRPRPFPLAAWPGARRLGRFAARLVPWALLGSLLFLLSGCDGPTDPNRPPYIAIVAIISAPAGTDVGNRYTYRVTEVSGTLHIDETISAAPTDTIIVPVKPATYKVSVAGVPSQCRFQGSPDPYLLVPENSNTAIVRYLISCDSRAIITTGTDGTEPDADYIYHLVGATVDRTGLMHGNDTLRVDDIPSGDYTVSLHHVAPNCVITSDGGSAQRLAVTDSGSVRAYFRVECANEAARPHLLSFASGYHDGASGFLFRAYDPNGDIERYYWDITDCAGTSVLPAGGGKVRRGLTQGVTAGRDTVTVFGAIELGRPETDFTGRCTSLRVVDYYGNSTPVLEEPIGNERPGPTAAYFNAIFTTTAALTTTLQVNTPGFAGVFAAASLRDGALFPADGQPDIGVYNASGYPDVLVPTVPLGGGRPPYYDYYSVILYLFDDAGNFTRLVDDDLFH